MKTYSMNTAFVVLLCAVLASCSKDTFSSSRDGSLPEGAYPMEFTAEGLDVGTLTRASVDGDWNGVESIAVWDNFLSTVAKRYSVTSTDGGKTAKLTSDDPIFWRSSIREVNIRAWYPYSESFPAEWKVKSDQSTLENYRASDFVYGSKCFNFDQRDDPSKSKIVFIHSISKVVVQLIAGPGVELDGKTSVQLLNVSGVETGTTVTACRPDATEQKFQALLTRQTIAGGTPFIQVSAGGKTFVYTPVADRMLEINHSSLYVITVRQPARLQHSPAAVPGAVSSSP